MILNLVSTVFQKTSLSIESMATGKVSNADLKFVHRDLQKLYGNILFLNTIKIIYKRHKN